MKKIHKISPKIKLKTFVFLNLTIVLLAFITNKYNNKIFDYALFPKNYYNKSTKFEFTDNINSASEVLFEKIKNDHIKNYDNVVLIIVESLGLAKNEELNQILSNAFNDKTITKNYNLTFAKVPFHGSTTHGEFRELCQKEFNSIFPKSTDKNKLKKCLPDLFADKNFKTYGIHNSNHFFYQRSMWYYNIGFDNIIFGEDMESDYGLKILYGPPFPGVREEKVFDKVFNDIMKKPEKKFIYFLTIESHIPVFSDLDRNEFSKISKNIKIFESDKQMRGIYEMYYNIFYNVAALAKKYSDKKNLFIIVGDHKPPFTVQKESDLFDNKFVPAYILESK